MALPAVEKAKKAVHGVFENLFGNSKKEAVKSVEKPVVPEAVIEKSLSPIEKKPVPKFRKLTTAEMAIGTKEEAAYADRYLPEGLFIALITGSLCAFVAAGFFLFSFPVSIFAGASLYVKVAAFMAVLVPALLFISHLARHGLK